MNLQEYLDIIGITKAAFATRLGITPHIIYAVINGTRTLSLFNGLLIEKATNGDVKAIDLCSQEERDKINRMESPYKKLDRMKNKEKCAISIRKKE